jgi:hypothetical protein
MSCFALVNTKGITWFYSMYPMENQLLTEWFYSSYLNNDCIRVLFCYCVYECTHLYVTWTRKEYEGDECNHIHT